ncbi:glutamate receptor ionotropic, delta-2-like isoform X1 [Centruroides sculpturatus]|uniref:glutamate receptor ionotropic, delta-2-like isoform X1 n=1 Tax=Centruroides sculpturatus TaxID=218467 RepID=UPI000C6D30F2|nr:glutamate receptor ionotropic, delta-2-like isoform X1 [Centruroides sculpturatus]
MEHIFKYEVINGTYVLIKHGGCISDALLITQEHLGFNLELVEEVDEGLRLDNGSWTGRIGYVQRNETDLGLPTGISYDRIDAVDYSNTRDVLAVKFMTAKPNELSKMLAIIYPFDLSVWIAMLIAFIVAGLSFYFILNLNSKINNTKRIKIYDILWALFSTFSNQGSDLFEVQGYSRIVVFCWLTSLFILVSSYGGALMSFLTFSGYEYVPETFPELIEEMKKGHYTASVLFHTGIGKYILDATEESSVFFELKKLTMEGKVLDVKPTDDVYEYLLKPKHALIEYEGDELMYMSALGEDQYLLSKDTLYTQFEIYAIAKGYRYKKEINTVMRRLTESGIIPQLDRIQENLVRNKKLVRNNHDIQAKPLSVHDLVGAFMFLLIGYALSIIMFILELSKKVKKRKISLHDLNNIS